VLATLITNASFRQEGPLALTAGSLVRLTGRVSTEQNTENDFGVATVRLVDTEGGALAESSTDAITAPNAAERHLGRILS